MAGCDELVYHFPLGISNHNKTDVKKFCHYNETGHISKFSTDDHTFGRFCQLNFLLSNPL